MRDILNKRGLIMLQKLIVFHVFVFVVASVLVFKAVDGSRVPASDGSVVEQVKIKDPYSWMKY